ncbi:hypothetical protein BT93_K1175 [Corymbia citriodora subsp. variegata]|nr:hypothetical protein BT93_K1175 [Corymbia citriodora subsp. variegata]
MAVQPLSKENSPVTLLPGVAKEKAVRSSGPSVLEAKLSSEDPRGSAPPTNPSDSPNIAPRKKPEAPKRNSNDASPTRSYRCKYCKAKFGTWQSLGGHQKAHRREHAAKKREREKNRFATAPTQVPIPRNPNAFAPCAWPAPAAVFRPVLGGTPKPTTVAGPNFGKQAIPVSGQPIAYGPRARPAPTGVVKPTYGWTPKPTGIMNPQASAGHRPAMVNQPNGMVYRLMNHNGDSNVPAMVSPRSTGPKPPPADVLASGSSSGTPELENEGLDLSLRL